MKRLCRRNNVRRHRISARTAPATRATARTAVYKRGLEEFDDALIIFNIARNGDGCTNGNFAFRILQPVAIDGHVRVIAHYDGQAYVAFARLFDVRYLTRQRLSAERLSVRKRIRRVQNRFHGIRLAR